MPTLVTKPTTEVPASSVRTSDPSLNASITMSSPPRYGGSTNDAATALTLSLGGVHFCLQPTDCTSGVALNRRDGNIVLSLTSFTGSLVVSTEGNLVALQALAGQAKQQAHATVEEEPHSPELLDKTNGQCKKGGTANKVSPGQQTLPFVVKKQVDKKNNNNNNGKKKQHKDPITTPITKNTKDRKRRNSIDDKADIDDSNTLSTEVASKKSRRGFFTLPTKKTADNNSNNKVDDIEEVKEPNSSGVVEDVPVFQTSQTQFTQSEEEGGDEQENSDNSNKGDDGMVDDVDVSQTMESSSYTTNNSVITTTTMNDVVAHQGKDGCESVATARGDEADEVLDEAGDMNDDDDEDGGDVKMENGGVVLQQQEHSTAVTTEIGSDDVEMIAGGGIEIAGYPAPPARWGHTMTTIQDDRILVYGGQSFDLEGNPIILSDVHIYSPSKRTWEKPINCRGESRQWHTATYIPQRQMVIAFGGETEETSTSSSTSAKKGQTITKVKTSETLRVLDTDIMLWYPPAVSGDIPSGRSGHSATYIPETNELLLFGGVRASKWLNAVSILDCRTWVWTTPKVEGSPPKPRSYHSATLVGTNKIVFFGGNNNRQSFNTVHVLEMVSVPSNSTAEGVDNSADPRCTWRWSNPTVSGQAPFPRTGHSATLLQDGKTICIYGGWDPNSDGDGEDGEENIFKGSYILDTQQWTWKEGPKVVAGGSGSPHHHLEDCGPKRAGHTAVLSGEEVLVFGGRIPGEILAGDIQRLQAP